MYGNRLPVLTYAINVIGINGFYELDKFGDWQ